MSRSDDWNWREDKRWEERRLAEVVPVMFAGTLTTTLGDGPLQRQGVDIIVHNRDGDQKWELKCVRYHSRIGAITIEELKNEEARRRGWIYESVADWLGWVFMDRAVCWRMQDLRFWWELQDEKPWPQHRTRNRAGYHSLTYKVPTKDIPMTPVLLDL